MQNNHAAKPSPAGEITRLLAELPSKPDAGADLMPIIRAGVKIDQ